ncbi:MAG: dethiobiotin synthase [Deltaproteobacteria bacterium]|nr:MAG: dethiobiotin synthase [Deltaproteobacteria bacterium]
MIWPKKMFVTGTDTGIGKTFICSLLMAGLRASYWKPIQSGSLEGRDSQWVRQATCLPESHFFPESYILPQPLSPHQAARMAGVEINLAACIPPVAESLIVEGAGGVLVPVNSSQTMLDLMVHLNYPVLVVAPGRLGMINHTLLTLDCLRRAGLEIVGVLINGGEEDEQTEETLYSFGKTEILTRIPWLKQDKISPGGLTRLYASLFWRARE